MSKIHFVGEEGSFTWLATNDRYRGNNNLIGGYDQQKLLEKLSQSKKNRITEAAIVPIWNSNYGTIIVNKRTSEDLTAGVLKGDAGQIIDLWGKHIIFKLGVHGKNLSHNGVVYSVIVAKLQCSDFFNKNMRVSFRGFKTTNIACQTFLNNKKIGNGLLCSMYLLIKYKINIIKQNIENPFNYTVFFGLNKYPEKTKNMPKVSLGCFLMDLQGHNELPTDFISHWRDITKTKAILSTRNVLLVLPKITFILRHERSKALLLMEMPVQKGLDDPWEGISGDTNIELLGQVGLLKKSFAYETCDLIKTYPKNSRKVVFYGRKHVDNVGVKENYFWVCDALKISVHGFEHELVKNCAKLQVIRLNNLLKEGIEFSDEAKDVLGQFSKNEKTLKLAADSKPDNH